MSTDTASETVLSERRLAANRANAQLSTGPITPEGKAKSSLNAVKTGLTGRAILLADAEEAAAYRAHIERLLDYWQPADVREHALVQALADTQWRLDAIPGLESGLYALGRLRYADLYAEEDPSVRRVLLDAHIENTEAKALRNLRLHERRLRRHYEQDEAELERLRQLRFEEEEEKEQAEAQRREEEAEQQRQAEQARSRAERRKARRIAASDETIIDAHPHGFEFSTQLSANQPPRSTPSLNSETEPRKN